MLATVSLCFITRFRRIPLVTRWLSWLYNPMQYAYNAQAELLALSRVSYHLWVSLFFAMHSLARLPHQPLGGGSHAGMFMRP